MNVFLHADAQLLNDASVVEKLVERAGLNDEAPHEYPQFLQPFLGRGWRIWQYPCQFAPYLHFLRDKQICRYLEIGVRHGGCFTATVAYLSRFNEMALKVGVEAHDFPVGRDQVESVGGYYLQMLSSDSAVKLLAHHFDWDLVMIDGNHEDWWVRHDFDLFRHKARYIALHDIVSDVWPGVPHFWDEIKADFPSRTWEWTKQYDEIARQGRSCMGIGLVQLEA